VVSADKKGGRVFVLVCGCGWAWVGYDMVART
jgi:hypothetical protein